MKNQQGAPEALFYADALDRCAEVDFDHIFVPAAAVIRRLHAENVRLAAMVEAQQPACDTARYCQSIQRCTAKDETRAQQPAPSAAAEVKLEPVYGDVLPPVGSRVFIRHGRDNDAHACIVTGYYAWGDLKGDKRLHRVFVRMVYEGTSIEQARMLCDCYPTAGAALAYNSSIANMHPKHQSPLGLVTSAPPPQVVFHSQTTRYLPFSHHIPASCIDSQPRTCFVLHSHNLSASRYLSYTRYPY